MNVKLAQKLYPKKTVSKIDTVSSLRRADSVLRDAFKAWNSLYNLRKLAERGEMYTFGNQLGDYISVDGTTMTKERYIISQGNVPLKNNLIRSTVKTIVGAFSIAQTEPICYTNDRDKQGRGEIMTEAIKYNYELNKLSGIDRLQLQYILLTGLAIYKTSYGYRNGKWDVWTDTPNYAEFFFDNHMKDPRMWDCHLVGELHDLSILDVMEKFSSNREQAEKIRGLYSVSEEYTVNYIESLTEGISSRNINFFTTRDPNRCRVIEVWRKEAKERIRVKDRLKGKLYKVEIEDEKMLIEENKKRVQEQSAMGIMPENMKLLEYEWFVDNYWYFYYLTPTGYILKEGETPFWHGEHPYSWKVYPFYNGKVYPFVHDYIDQQDYINRIIMMQDMVMRHTAKGILMFPEECKPDGMTMDQIAETWSSYDGIIYYKPKPGVPAPQQIIVNSSNTGYYDMLQVQLKMFQDVSGIQGAMQGQAPAPGTPAALFMQQTQNAQLALVDIFETFKECREARDWKTMKTMQQFYNEERYINISGRSTERIIYRPQDVQNAEFDLRIEESTSTPVYRMIMNEWLMQLQQQQQITLDELLQVGAFPFADKLRQVIQSRQDQAQQNGAPMVPPEIQEQINAGIKNNN